MLTKRKQTRSRIILAVSIGCIATAIVIVVSMSLSDEPHESGQPAAASLLPSDGRSTNKEDQLKSMAEGELTKSAPPKPIVTSPKPPDPSDTGNSERTAGIDNAMHYGPFPSASFQVVNMYQGPYAGSWILVYAGRTDVGEDESEDSGPADGQGGVRIFTEDESDTPTLVGTFADTHATGALTVVSANEANIDLVDDTGRAATFDLRSDTFTSS